MQLPTNGVQIQIMGNKKHTKRAHPAPKEAELLQTAVQVLAGYEIPAEVVRKDAKAGANPMRADAVMRLTIGGARRTYLVEVKRWLTPATLGHVVTRLRDLGKDTILVTDYVTPPVAEKLKEMDVAFIDAAGNAYLRYPPAIVWVVGRKPAVTRQRFRAGRAFQPTGIKLIFALLCRPDLINAGFREIAEFAGVAHGTVGWVLGDLREMGYLVETGNKRARVRRLRDRRKLLAQWTEAYARTLRPQLLMGHYQAADLDWWKKLNVTKYKVLLGAEPAAAMATQHLRPGIVTIYTVETPAHLMVDYRLRKSTERNVEIRHRFWPFDHEWGHPDLAPPVLIYADLLATGEARCIEAAQLLYDRYLARFIEND
ncbi:MAG: type IV toxin-antitoxin system AbiEi family antitoxin [Sulfuricaulis sp.]|nr:type IV toxin-antitoxin system AbiEi family antitoxin [Sulfuricaulis sp.]